MEAITFEQISNLATNTQNQWSHEFLREGISAPANTKIIKKIEEMLKTEQNKMLYAVLAGKSYSFDGDKILEQVKQELMTTL